MTKKQDEAVLATVVVVVVALWVSCMFGVVYGIAHFVAKWW